MKINLSMGMNEEAVLNKIEKQKSREQQKLPAITYV
jgi:hypothetical protein